MSMIKQSSSNGEFKPYHIIAKEVKPGDLIEVKRGNYRHWLLCESVQLGAVWCFHVSSVEGSSSFSGRPTEDVLIKYQMLEDVVNDSEDGKPSLCRINNQETTAQIKTDGKDFPDLSQVFKELHLKKGTTVEYDWRRRNCEHYCTEWKYGIGWSTQVEDVQDAADWAVIGSTCAVVALGFAFVAYAVRRR